MILSNAKKFWFELQLINRYVDGNPDIPGRICAAQLCGLCNGHGDCIYNEATKNVTCSCVGGYTGEFCEIEPAKTLLLLFLILSILLLLLSLCFCLYFCSRLRYLLLLLHLIIIKIFFMRKKKKQQQIVVEIIKKIFKKWSFV